MKTLLAGITNNPWAIAGIYAAAILAAVCVLVFLLLVFLIFINTSYRSPLKKRTRECTQKKDEAQMLMFAEGVEWSQKYKDKTEQLQIVSDGLNLYGEYINFGFDKCAIILQGRSESLLYSYYFAEVYANNGHNIFVVDFRAHGLSDGKYQTGGIKESDDLILWIKLINERFNIADFTIHGICIGGAAAVFTYIKLKNEGNGLIKRIVADGLFKSYYELFKNHSMAFKGPMPPAVIRPVNYVVFFLLFILAKVRPFKETPIKYMKDIDIPILFIWSAMDKFCIKPNSEELFEACASEHKEVCFFPKGRHTHVRASQKTEYDGLIDKFLKKHI
jgi:pimeloyl-ACP methyl ester carboxylesterase